MTPIVKNAGRARLRCPVVFDSLSDKLQSALGDLRKKGTLDGDWSGIITIDWKRIPITIAGRHLRSSDLGIQNFAIDQPHFTIESTEGTLVFDLHVGDGVITGTLSAQGMVYPILLTRSRG